MRKRIIASIIGLPLVIFCIVYGGLFLKALVLAVSLMGMFEFNLAFSKDVKPVHFIGYIFAVYFVFNSGDITYQTNYMNIFVSLFILTLLVYTVIFNSSNKVMDTLTTFFGFFYVCFIFVHIDLIRNHALGLYFVWLVFISAWGSDTGAYFVGLKFGKHKLIPSLSPKKTVEGAVGGVISAAALAFVYGLIINRFFDIDNTSIIYIYPIIGFAGSILGQIGDLAASAMKRYAKIKDFGKIIPGHGGILDRFDSVLLTAPAVYYIMLLLMEV